MFSFTVKELVEKFQQDIDSGWLKPDDVVGLEYWTYDDVKDFVDGDDYYGEVTDDIARKVWENVVSDLRGYDNVDCDMVRDSISYCLDVTVKENGEK